MKQTLHLASVAVLLLAASAFGEVACTDGWRPYATRDEIAPRSWSDRDAQGGLRLGLAGRGDDAVDGRWAREAPVVPGKTYAFAAAYRAQGVVSPSRSVLARLVWLDAAGETMRPMEYPLVGPSGPDGWTPVAGVYRAPRPPRRRASSCTCAGPPRARCCGGTPPSTKPRCPRRAA